MGKPPKFIVVQLTKKRDEILSNLKTLLFYNSINLENFLLYSSKLFRYDKSIQLNEHFDVYSFLDYDVPIDLYYIQNKVIDFIKIYMSLNRSQFINLVKYLRNKNLAEYNNNCLDLDYNRLVNFYSKNYVGLFTTKDGNCLFHSISLNLFGSESYSFPIKLATVFIAFEYEEFIRKYLFDYAYTYNFETLIQKTVKYGVWGSEIHFILFSILLIRPVYSFTTSYSLFSNPSNSTGAPIVLFLKNSHFVVGIRANFNGSVSVPRCNQLRFFKGNLPSINFY